MPLTWPQATHQLWPIQPASGLTITSSFIFLQSVSALFLKALFEMEDTEAQRKAVQMVTAFYVKRGTFQMDSVAL